jgi:hypothetical protein
VSRSYLNLARDPYVNTRPVVRLSIVLWIIGGLLFAGNVWLYWDFLAGRGDTHARLEKVADEIDSAHARIASLESELAGFDLAEQNDRVAFLNSRIDRRHFSWSRLFDALAGLLPEDVRLTRLAPSSVDVSSQPGRRASSDKGEKVSLGIHGVARTNDSILNLVDELYGDPAFDDTILTQQRNVRGGLIEFDMDTLYDPRPPGEATPGEPEAADAPAAQEPGGTTTGRRPTGLGPAASSAPEVVR